MWLIVNRQIFSKNKAYPKAACWAVCCSRLQWMKWQETYLKAFGPRCMWMTWPFTSLDRKSSLQNSHCRLQWIGSPDGLCNMVFDCRHRRPLVFILTGNEICGSAKPNVLKKLDPVHNMALRYCTGAFRSSPIVSLCAESGEHPLQHRRDPLLLQYYLLLYRLTNSPAYNAIFDLVVVDLYEGNTSISAPFGVRARRLIANISIHGIDVLS